MRPIAMWPRHRVEARRMTDHKSTVVIAGQNRDDGWPREQGVVMERNKRARLLIADDHLLLAEACKNLLEPEFEVVAIVGDGRALLQVAADLRPDVVIVDIAMPQLNGLDAGEQVKQL